jgi:hypothetical protein
LADKGVVAHLKWEWQDRGGFRGRKRTRRQEVVYSLKDIRDGLYGGEALGEHTMLDHIEQVQKDMHDLANEVERIRNILDAPRQEKQLADFLASRAAEEAAAKQAAEAKTPTRRKRGQAAPS